MSAPIQTDAVRLRRHDRLELDACDRCRGVWFDAVELARIWNGELERLLAAERQVTGRTGRRPGEVPLVVDALAVDPFLTLWVADAALHSVPTLAVGAGELIGAVPEAAAAVVEGTAGLAESVFEKVRAPTATSKATVTTIPMRRIRSGMPGAHSAVSNKIIHIRALSSLSSSLSSKPVTM